MTVNCARSSGTNALKQMSALLGAHAALRVAMSTSESDVDEHSCELGKLSHWEQVYQQELSNFEATGDEGEIWYQLRGLYAALSLTALLERTTDGAGLAKT